jgi:hypothetical protein
MTSLVKPYSVQTVITTPAPYDIVETTVKDRSGTTAVWVQYVSSNNPGISVSSTLVPSFSAAGWHTFDGVTYYPNSGPRYITTTTVRTYYPPAVATLVVATDRAWNSYARSIDPIAFGEGITFSVPQTVYGVFVGLTLTGSVRTFPDSYTYGVMIDASGVNVFENGAAVRYLGSKNSAVRLGISVATDGAVYYTYGTTVVASSQPPIPYGTQVHAVALLYSAGDSVQDAVIAPIALSTTSVAMPVSVGLSARTTPLVSMPIATDLVVQTSEPFVRMAVYSDLVVTPADAVAASATMPVILDLDVAQTEAGHGVWGLPNVLLYGTDYDAPARSAWRLPSIRVSGAEATYIPPALTEGFWLLAPLRLSALGTEEDIASVNWSLPPVLGHGNEVGANYEYADWRIPGPPLLMGVDSTSIGGALTLLSVARPTAGLSIRRDIVLGVNSYGQLTSTLTLTRQQTLSLLSTLAATTDLTLVGTYLLDATSLLIGQSMQSLTLPTGAELPEDAAVWVVNLDGQSKASVQYENYGFNSFFQQGGAYYGVANDGIYELAGGTDAGDPIQAYLNLGRSNLGVQGVKHMPSVYIGAASDGKLILRTDTDGVVRYYRARVSTADLTQQRVDIGRGVRGTFWELEVINENGDDFDLADLTLLPVALDRRV